jgi:diaminohydroxyphosphoribosylaminopyrimidine deaminase/5-amino-6-(5-phosphoribosylamino)uracil reductase
LTVRHWLGKNPLRILIDSELKITSKSKVLDQSSDTLVVNELVEKVSGNITYIKIKKDAYLLKNIMHFLFEKEIQSVIVEGGKMLIEKFIEKDLWDEARVIVGQKNFIRGLKAPVVDQETIYEEMIVNDKLIIYRNPK